jgi:hypothetical protein
LKGVKNASEREAQTDTLKVKGGESAVIYAVQASLGNSVTIGHSDNIPVRIAQLEHHYGLPLRLLAMLEGGILEERAIHEKFAHLRYGSTDQFRAVPELMAFLGCPPQPKR